jgi:hypothetical protein
VLAAGHVEVAAAVVVALVAVALGTRRKRAPTLRALKELAGARGWQFKRTLVPHRDTPFLRLGDDQEAGPGFVLQLLGLELEVYEHRRMRVSGDSRVCEATYVVLRLKDGLHLTGVDQIRLMPRESASATAAALNDRRVVSLESTELDSRFLLEAGSGTSDLTVRELFTPALIAALLDLASADCYLGEYLDFSLGRLVLASGGTITATDGPAVEETLRRVTPVLERFAHFAEQRRPGADAPIRGS